jgi:hypothetical protein
MKCFIDLCVMNNAADLDHYVSTPLQAPPRMLPAARTPLHLDFLGYFGHAMLGHSTAAQR